MRTTAISGTLKIGGANIGSTTDAGTLSMIGSDDSFLSLGSTADLTYSFRLIPDVYDIFYSGNAAGALAPRNKWARLGCYRAQ